MDSSTLHGLGLPKEAQDRIYQSLYVHSVGFFGFIKDVTKHLKEGRDVFRINVWKVF